MRGIHGLRQAGCGAIAIPCNNVHGWYAAMADAAGVPILHIVDAAAAELRRIGMAGGLIGVIGTEATIGAPDFTSRRPGHRGANRSRRRSLRPPGRRDAR